MDPLQIPNVWRAQSMRPASTSIPTGYAELDAALGGGWPQPALIEILTDVYGIGELQLVLPLLITLAKRPPQPPLIFWINPPHTPNAVALAQHRLTAHQWLLADTSERNALWATERAVRCGACSAVLAWLPAVKSAELRRLKLATTTSSCTLILYRRRTEASQPSPASVRALLTPTKTGLHVELLKIQGRRPGTVVLARTDSAGVST